MLITNGQQWLHVEAACLWGKLFQHCISVCEGRLMWSCRVKCEAARHMGDFVHGRHSDVSDSFVSGCHSTCMLVFCLCLVFSYLSVFWVWS